MIITEPEALRALVETGEGRDRAFVDAMVRMGWLRTDDPAKRAELEEIHATVKENSLRIHTSLRESIAAGALRGAELRKLFDDVPLFERDHFIEEVLGIAYPPLEEPALGPELVPYSPSGYDEIVHAFDVTRLGPGDHFVDIGSGMGKAMMLAALLADATSSGIECNGLLNELAGNASRALGLAGLRFKHGDARELPAEDGDVLFMYLPFTGNTLATVLESLIEKHRDVQRPGRRYLCAGALELSRYRELVPAGPSKSWLNVYAWR